MAPINLDHKSWLKFGLFCYNQETCKLTFSPQSHHFKFRWQVEWCWGWCWQCGRVAEPSCVALCDFNHPPTRQSKDPIAPPHAHADTYHTTEFQEFFSEKKSDVSPKREALQYKFNQGHHSKGFPMLNSAFWTRVWWHVDCGNQDARMIQKLTRFRS